MPWRNENELRKGNQSYEDRCEEVQACILCNIDRHKHYLNTNYEELQDFDFVQSDEEENNVKIFSNKFRLLSCRFEK